MQIQAFSIYTIAFIPFCLLCILRFSEKIKSSAWKSLNMLNQPSCNPELLSRLCFLRIVRGLSLSNSLGLSSGESWSMVICQTFFLLVKRKSSESQTKIRESISKNVMDSRDLSRSIFFIRIWRLSKRGLNWLNLDRSGDRCWVISRLNFMRWWILKSQVAVCK